VQKPITDRPREAHDSPAKATYMFEILILKFQCHYATKIVTLLPFLVLVLLITGSLFIRNWIF
jgi:hypothetical protein